MRLEPLTQLSVIVLELIYFKRRPQNRTAISCFMLMLSIYVECLVTNKLVDLLSVNAPGSSIPKPASCVKLNWFLYIMWIFWPNFLLRVLNLLFLFNASVLPLKVSYQFSLFEGP